MNAYARNLARMFYESMYSMEREHWIIAFVLALAIGAICLKGYGSRTSY